MQLPEQRNIQGYRATIGGGFAEIVNGFLRGDLHRDRVDIPYQACRSSWDSRKNPWIPALDLAGQLGMTERVVRKLIAELYEARYIKKKEGGQASRV